MTWTTSCEMDAGSLKLTGKSQEGLYNSLQYTNEILYCRYSTRLLSMYCALYVYIGYESTAPVSSLYIVYSMHIKAKSGAASIHNSYCTFLLTTIYIHNSWIYGH